MGGKAAEGGSRLCLSGFGEISANLLAQRFGVAGIESTRDRGMSNCRRSHVLSATNKLSEKWRLESYATSHHSNFARRETVPHSAPASTSQPGRWVLSSLGPGPNGDS